VKVVECRDDSHCVQINSSPLSVFADVCADFGHPLPDWHAVTDPLKLIRIGLVNSYLPEIN